MIWEVDFKIETGRIHAFLVDLFLCPLITLNTLDGFVRKKKHAFRKKM